MVQHSLFAWGKKFAAGVAGRVDSKLCKRSNRTPMMVIARGRAMTINGLNPIPLSAETDGRLVGGQRKKAYLKNFR